MERKNQKEMLEVKNTGRNENAFDGLVGWLEMAEERSSEPEDILTETSPKRKGKRKRDQKKKTKQKPYKTNQSPFPQKNRISKNRERTRKGVIKM